MDDDPFRFDASDVPDGISARARICDSCLQWRDPATWNRTGEFHMLVTWLEIADGGDILGRGFWDAGVWKPDEDHHFVERSGSTTPVSNLALEPLKTPDKHRPSFRNIRGRVEGAVPAVPSCIRSAVPGAH